jgi:hypothetical protein
MRPEAKRVARRRHPSSRPRSRRRIWYERNTGHRITDIQRQVKHSAIPWMAATLDGIVEQTAAVFEAKFMMVRASDPPMKVRRSCLDFERDISITSMIVFRYFYIKSTIIASQAIISEID